MVLWNQEFLLIKSCSRESSRRSLVLDLRFLLGSILPYTQKWILARRFFGNGYKIERKMLMSFRFKTTLGNETQRKDFAQRGKTPTSWAFTNMMVNLEKDFKIREWHFFKPFLSTVECLACFWYCLCTVGPLWENMRLAFQIIKQKAYFFPLFLSYLLTQYLFFCLKTLRLCTIW